MSDSPINLNKVRKARARAADKARANANSVAFGRTKGEKTTEASIRARMARNLDGAALERPSNQTDDDPKKS